MEHDGRMAGVERAAFAGIPQNQAIAPVALTYARLCGLQPPS